MSSHRPDRMDEAHSNIVSVGNNQSNDHPHNEDNNKIEDIEYNSDMDGTLNIEYNTVDVVQSEPNRSSNTSKRPSKKNAQKYNAMPKRRRQSKLITGIKLLHTPPSTITAEKELRFKNNSKSRKRKSSLATPHNSTPHNSTPQSTTPRNLSPINNGTPRIPTPVRTPTSPGFFSKSPLLSQPSPTLFINTEKETGAFSDHEDTTNEEMDALVSLHPKQSIYQSKQKQSLFLHKKLKKFDLSIMPFFLVFSNAKAEREFVNFYYGRNLFRFRATTIILLLCYAIFGVFWDFSQESLYFETHIVITCLSIFSSFLISIPIHVNYLLNKYKRIVVAELTIFSFIFVILTASLFKSLFAIIYDSFYYPIGSAITIAICFTLPHPRIYILYILSILYLLLYIVIMIALIYGEFIPYQHRYLLYLLVIVVSLVPSLIVNYFMEYQVRVNFKLSKEIKHEKDYQLNIKHHSDKLLRNVLPKALVPIAREYMVNGRLAQAYYHQKSKVSVLLMDIVNFTDFCSRTPAAEIIFLLNKYFCSFDRYTQQLKLEKVKTIGDAYLAVGGLFPSHLDQLSMSSNPSKHMMNIIMLGQYMLEEIEKFNESFKWEHSVRIGISFGNIIYAMLGKQTISFDIFGEALDEAYKLEALATHNTLNLSKKGYRLAAHVLDNFINPNDKLDASYTIAYNSRLITALQVAAPSNDLLHDPSFNDLTRLESTQTLNQLVSIQQPNNQDKTFVMDSNEKDNLKGRMTHFTKDVESYLKPKTKTYLVPLLLFFKGIRHELEYIKHGWASSFWYNSILYHFSLVFYACFIIINMIVLFTEHVTSNYFIIMYSATLLIFLCSLMSLLPIAKHFYIGSFLVIFNHFASYLVLIPLYRFENIRELASLPLSIYFMFFIHIPLSIPYFIKFIYGAIPIAAFLTLSIIQHTFTMTALGFLLGIHFLLSISYYYIDLLNRYGYLLKRELDRDGVEIEKEYIRTHALIRASMPRDILIILRRSNFQPLKIRSRVTNCAIAFLKVSNLLENLPRNRSAKSVYRVLDLLNKIFIEFDEYLREFECVRIKTVGSAYMVVCGCPSSISEPAAKLTRFSLKCHAETLFLPGLPDKVQITTGIHFGNISAGVIGHTKFLYDVVGDVPNVASRLLTTSKVGGIQVSEEIVNELHNTSNYSFGFERRGSINMKGKGMINTYYITNCKEL